MFPPGGTNNNGSLRYRGKGYARGCSGEEGDDVYYVEPIFTVLDSIFVDESHATGQHTHK